MSGFYTRVNVSAPTEVVSGVLFYQYVLFAICMLSFISAALKSWKRIIYAFLSLLGLSRVRTLYLKKRKKDLRDT